MKQFSLDFTDTSLKAAINDSWVFLIIFTLPICNVNAAEKCATHSAIQYLTKILSNGALKEVAMPTEKLLRQISSCHKTILNFHMNNFGTIIDNKVGFIITKKGYYF